MADYRFTISLNTFDASLLPPGSPPKGSTQYSAAVHKFLQAQFAGFKGDARIVVSEDSILVEWRPPSTEQIRLWRRCRGCKRRVGPRHPDAGIATTAASR